MKPSYWDDATRALGQRDRVLRRIIRRHPEIHLRRRSDPFTALARAIVGQQISVRAADTIWGRLLACGRTAPPRGAFPRLDPQLILDVPTEALRAAGLSGSKAAYLCDLAQHFVSGSLEPRRWRRLDDEAVIDLLTEVKGIGRWTAEMFLIFHELRADVLPVADIGLQRAMALHYNAGAPLPLPRMREIGAAWAPYRSVATWYLWRSLDPVVVEY